jgi:hypothetical protein
VIKFHNSSVQIDYAILEPEIMYRFYIGRVSAISTEYSNFVGYEYLLLDSQGIIYDFNWKNDSMANIISASVFDFGTATGSIYTTNLTAFCEVNAVNIAYAIEYVGKIGEIIDENITDPENNTEPENTEGFMNLAFLPEEWILGTTIFIGCTMAILTVMLVNNRKKNAVGLNLKEK